jgi:tryptophan synthase beta chain|tara:strand:- start:9411 stop:11036 length:1626 start_codon:yes stop_codon:yes gene_type:complete
MAPYDRLIGDVGAELTPVWVTGPPSLDIPRAFIAEGRDDDIGFNSLIEGDDDGTLAIADKYATLPRNNNVPQAAVACWGGTERIMTDTVKYTLPEDRIPKAWYNINADLPEPLAPVLHPGTGQPIGPDDLAPLFPMALIGQEVSAEREIEIPEPVREIYRQWRPSPLHRARQLERALDTPAKIYYKYEGVSPTGSHKPNTAVAQAFYNKEAGTKKITTETGAGQWGSSLAFAGNLFGLEIDVYMVKVSFEQKPYRKALMETFGARCVASPSEETQSGRAVLAEHPDSTGSLGIAISEAVEMAAQNDDTKYALGSVLNHVLLHQTVVGQEAIEQMNMAGNYPDIIVGCTGGGSNFAGLVNPFLGEQLRGGPHVRVIAVEPAACPSLTRGKFAYDFGDTGHLTPLVKMHTLGSTFVPPGFHAGGLRYHGMGPLVSHLHELGLIEARAYQQLECFEAGVQFARAEGIVPAPEATHAVKGAIDEALKCKEAGTGRTILFNLCGHGHFDMQAYTDYFAGDLTDQSYDESELAMALAGLPSVATAAE